MFSGFSDLLVRALTHRSLAREQAVLENAKEGGWDGVALGPATTSGWSFWATRCWGWWLRSRSSACILTGMRAS
jgi:hypothetical protein